MVYLKKIVIISNNDAIVYKNNFLLLHVKTYA